MTERNITLDYFKLFLIVLVVAIHIDLSPFGYVGFIISKGIADIAVPCFFIINGYFLAEILNDKKKMKRYIKKLLIIYTVWMCIYSPFYINYTIYPKLIILSDLLFGFYHLWYIAALIVASIILYILRKCKYQYLFIAALSLYISAIILQKLVITEGVVYEYKMIFFRNFVFVGFPFLTIGYVIKQAKRNNKLNFSKKTLGILTLVSLFFLLIEQYAEYIREGITFDKYVYTPDFFTLLIILCPLLFLFVLKISRSIPDDGFISKLSSSIYFIHPLIIFLLTKIIDIKYPLEELFPIIFFLSALLSVALLRLNKRFNIFL